MARMQAGIDKAQARLESIDEARELLRSGNAELTACQKDLEKHRQKVIDALGGGGIVENKVLARLDEVLAKRDAERVAIVGGIAAMEQDLEELELRHGAFREGLVPVVAKREELRTP